jgi:exodeoxyribonuclease V alpha subunit
VTLATGPFEPAVHLALRATGLLAEHNRAGVLTAADVHVATRLGRLGGEEDETVLLAVALLVRSTRQGSVMLPVADARRSAEPDPDEAAMEMADSAAVADDLTWPEPDAWLAAIARSPLVAADDADGRRPIRLSEGALWLDRYWHQEVAVADDLLRRAADAPDVDTARLHGVLARLWPDDGPHDQRLAAAVAVLSRVAVVAGGPGTGKTTTVARLVAALRELSPAGSALRLALAAPTGRAAARLQEALRSSADDERVGFTGEERAWLRGLEASTLHRLLGARPGSSWLRYDRDSPLPVDALVVDEASMVSLTSVARLLAALPPAARLILVGDPDQLASVEAGAVLADLTAAGSRGARTRAMLDRLQLATPADVTEHAPVVEPSPSARVGDGIAVLRRVHRFGGAIAELAQAIRDGDGDATLSVLRGGHEAVRFAEVDDDGPLSGGVLADLRAETLTAAGAVLAAARAGDGAGALAALERYRLMCAHRRGPRGVAHWQRTVEAWVADELGVRPNRAGRYPGLPLLVRSNDPDNHLSNGDTGVVLQEEGGLVAVFGQPAAMLRVPLGRLDDVVPLRALTVHRSQGGQFDRVAVLLPSPASSLATRETIYTAVTRAKEAVTVVGSEAAVRRSVERPAARATGLGRRLTAPRPTSSGTS